MLGSNCTATGGSGGEEERTGSKLARAGGVWIAAVAAGRGGSGWWDGSGSDSADSFRGYSGRLSDGSCSLLLQQRQHPSRLLLGRQELAAMRGQECRVLLATCWNGWVPEGGGFLGRI